MLLTNCAACAAPLAHDAPRCIRCWTRYCDSTCQHDHWRRGHKQICKKIHRGGNAEQYYADKKYKEAVAEAVEACADEGKLRQGALRRRQRHARRCPRGRDDARGSGADHAARDGRRAPALRNDRAGFAKSASRPPRPRYNDRGATLDDVREAVTTLEDTIRIARRVLGGTHPLTAEIEAELRDAEEALRVCETPSESTSA